MELTLKQRFDIQLGGNGQVFAPLSMGCPSMLFEIDRSVFKKSMEEKMKLFTHRQNSVIPLKKKPVTIFKGAF